MGHRNFPRISLRTSPGPHHTTRNWPRRLRSRKIFDRALAARWTWNAVCWVGSRHARALTTWGSRGLFLTFYNAEGTRGCRGIYPLLQKDCPVTFFVLRAQITLHFWNRPEWKDYFFISHPGSVLFYQLLWNGHDPGCWYLHAGSKITSSTQIKIFLALYTAIVLNFLSFISF